MRRGILALVVLGLIAACQAGSSSGEPVAIHPQPQPNGEQISFTSPCTAATCGQAPGSIANARCKPAASACAWGPDTAVSARMCDDTECGAAPGADVCGTGTTFKGSSCISENESACAWSTVCAPPPSTVPCSNVDGCGGKPELGVVCQDGSIGDLVCMSFPPACGWQRTCD